MKYGNNMKKSVTTNNDKIPQINSTRDASNFTRHFKNTMQNTQNWTNVFWQVQFFLSGFINEILSEENTEFLKAEGLSFLTENYTE